MSERALLLEAHHTTHIEGTRLTLAEAAQAFAGENVPQADADDIRELLNYREAFNLVSDYLGSGAAISEGLIREIHKRLVAGVRGERAKPGEYRRMQNYIANSLSGEIIYTPPPAGDVPGLMQDLVAWMNDPGPVHPVLASGIAQFQLVHIHPFVDGNGRTSRLLSTLSLYRAGYDFKRLFTLSEYYDRDRSAFYTALQSVRETDLDLTGWLEYFITGLDTQLAEVKERGRQAIQVDVLAQEHGLNVRQVAALRYVMQQGHLTIQTLETLVPGISRRTLQRDLKAMIEKGIVTVEGATHQLIYRLPAAD
ncbi:MAG: Fic family protein [Caldilineaceae bacterium]|nr:Fic family protein [Caldilineaceae bacterium]MBP8108600.1 Fic family protein [Caldilineaceae bacterium]MBP8121278.1 Fic family protein [Caldilineaceae bacterium]MBP9070844.1 Fic family protein [Caldilineaceae bacterium]